MALQTLSNFQKGPTLAVEIQALNSFLYSIRIYIYITSSAERQRDKEMRPHTASGKQMFAAYPTGFFDGMGDFRPLEREEGWLWSISLRDASHSRCSISNFRNSIKPCSTSTTS